MKHKIKLQNVPKIREWFASRGGIAIWGCVDLGALGTEWTTPIGSDKPHWSATSEPVRIITDPAECVVLVPKLVKRFHAAIRACRGGMAYKCTEATTRKIEAALRKARKGDTVEAWHEFDYDTQDALIFVADREVPLPEVVIPK